MTPGMEGVMAQLEVNGAELYYEVCGGGPPVLLIMGFTGDAGHFETLAGALASEFTVISYDRRGNGRSPRPPGWAATRPEEQADDAAALLAALGLSPAAIFGTSAGANFALCLLIRHPETVSGAVLHETALVKLFDDPGARGAVSELVQEAMGTGGTPAALEALWRYVAGGPNWERLQPALRARMQSSAETFFGVELGSYEGFLPDDKTLAAIAVPVMVLVSEQSHAVYARPPADWPTAWVSRSRARPARTPPTTTTRTNWHRPSGRSCGDVLPAAVITALHPAGSPRSHNEAFRITDGNIAAGNQAAPSRRSGRADTFRVSHGVT
jgi:pimeloyl-ACP methyl ester carboxylesterase